MKGVIALRKTTKKTKGTALVATVILALFVGTFMSSCSDEMEPGKVENEHPAITGVELAKVGAKDRPVYYEATGTIMAGTMATVSAQTFGEVKSVLVTEGDEVKAGQDLVILDRTQVEAQLGQARAAKNAASAQVELARETFERFKELKKRDAVSAQEYDEVEAKYRQAVAAKEQAEAAYRSALEMKRDATVAAPFDGVVSSEMVDEGDLANPGRPLVVIETSKGYRVEINMPESRMESIQNGDTVHVTVPATGVELAGTVYARSPSADPRSRSFLVKVSLPEHEGLKSGTYARVTVPMGKSESLMAPRTAIVTRGQLEGVYKVDEDNIARYRLVRTGRDYNGHIEIVSGLSEGDLIVSDPPPKLTDGMKVSEAK